jgi:hypothetical protein
MITPYLKSVAGIVLKFGFGLIARKKFNLIKYDTTPSESLELLPINLLV